MNRRLHRSRAPRVAIAVGFGIAALFGARATTPGNVFACYCVAPDSVAEYRTQPEIAIVAGTLIDASTFRVERLYRGPVAVGANPILVDSSSCGFPMQKGERWILAARVFKGELRPSICDLNRVGTEGGDALLADIAAVFGAQEPLGDDSPVATDPGIPAPGPASAAATFAPPASPADVQRELALPVILASVVVVTLLLFGAIAVVARRSRTVR